MVHTLEKHGPSLFACCASGFEIVDGPVEHLERFSQGVGDTGMKECRVDLRQPQTHRRRGAAGGSAQKSRERSAFRGREAAECELVTGCALLESSTQAASKGGKFGPTEQSL
jgi:hypothetical protein